MIDVCTSRWSFRLRDFPKELLTMDNLRVSGRLVGAEPVGIDRGSSFAGFLHCHCRMHFTMSEKARTVTMMMIVIIK